MRNHLVTRSCDPVFRVLADPTRRAVLDLLRHGRRHAGQIARAFPVSRPAISKHLRLLRQARLVREHRVGRHRFYDLDAQPLRDVDRWLEHYRRFWHAKLASLKDFVESSPPRASESQEKGMVKRRTLRRRQK